MIDYVSFLLDQIFYSFIGNRTYRQVIGIPMGTNCAVINLSLCPNFKDPSKSDIIDKFDNIYTSTLKITFRLITHISTNTTSRLI